MNAEHPSTKRIEEEIRNREPSTVQPIVMRFDPFDCDSEETAEVFRDDVARTLYLLWRRGHIVSDGFPADVLMVAGNIKAKQPANVDELAFCFRGHARGQMYGTRMNFPTGDVRRFCESHLEYFTGGKSIDYRVELFA